MCTLVVAHRAWDGVPLLVAANRDERLDRPALPPRRGEAGRRRIFAPFDLTAGGTWIGVNDRGVFAGITNRFNPRGLDPGRISADRRSRGLLVLDALAEESADAAYEKLGALRGDEHNPFHLVLGDLVDAFVVWSDGTSLDRSVLGPGVHVVTERSFGAAPSGREEALQRAAAAWQAEAAPPLDSMRAELAAHRSDVFDSTCVHADERNYGTRSASIVSYSASGPAEFHFADGPSCRTAWTDLSGRMRDSIGG
jgi:uncharacterized protein with NRDE domain